MHFKEKCSLTDAVVRDFSEQGEKGGLRRKETEREARERRRQSKKELQEGERRRNRCREACRGLGHSCLQGGMLFIPRPAMLLGRATPSQGLRPLFQLTVRDEPVPA